MEEGNRKWNKKEGEGSACRSLIEESCRCHWRLAIVISNSRVASDTGNFSNVVIFLNIFLIVLFFTIFFEKGLKNKKTQFKLLSIGVLLGG